MDNWRGYFPDHENNSHDARDFDGEEDVGGGDPLPLVIGQDERRMQVRAYNFWTGLLGDRNFPSVDQIDPDSLTDFGSHSVLLNFATDIENPAIAYLGEKLAIECGAEGVIKTLADVPGRSLLSRITDHYLQIIANQAPIGFEAEFVNQRGNTILYRGILLPFSSDNQTIDYIYGVINWKQLADQQTADELLLEIDQALAPSINEIEEPLPMPSWADGPVDDNSVLDLSEELPDPFDRPISELLGPLFHASASVSLPDSESLADLLASARDLANEAKASQVRTHQALYAAIGVAYDFWLAAKQEPEEFLELMKNAGFDAPKRSSMTPIVKLVFGTDYDKTRVAEIAAVLDHAYRLGLRLGELAGFLGEMPGGLKAVVAEERRLRRGEKAALTTRPAKTGPREKIARKLRELESRGMDSVPAEGSEFTLLIARRAPNGEVVLLGEVSQDIPLIERAAKHLWRKLARNLY